MRRNKLPPGSVRRRHRHWAVDARKTRFPINRLLLTRIVPHRAAPGA
jgi:hypothetical protein